MLPSNGEADDKIRSPEDAVYKALAAGRYLIFVARLDHLGEGGFNTYVNYRDLPPADIKKCPTELRETLHRMEGKAIMDQAFDNALVAPLEAGPRIL